MTRPSSTTCLDTISRLEGPIQSAEETRLSVGMDLDVDLLEPNANLWMALVNGSVTQVAECSALGFKASDFEWLLNFLALGYLGHGAT